MAKFSKTLHDKARQLAVGFSDTRWDPAIPATIQREIALMVDQITRQKDFHAKQLRQLLQIECAVGTDLMELEQRIPWYTFNDLPAKETLKQRLLDIDKDRRRLNQRYEEKLHALEERLLNLIHKHQQLDT